MLRAQGWSAVVIVEHVGREGALNLISVRVSHHLLFRPFFLLLLGGAFGGTGTCTGGSCDSCLVLFNRLVFVSAAGLGLL